jgi:hypothetical protein
VRHQPAAHSRGEAQEPEAVAGGNKAAAVDAVLSQCRRTIGGWHKLTMPRQLMRFETSHAAQQWAVSCVYTVCTAIGSSVQKARFVFMYVACHSAALSLSVLFDVGGTKGARAPVVSASRFGGARECFAAC